MFHTIKPHQIQLNERPSLQLCLYIASVLKEVNPLIRSDNYFFCDGLGNVRTHYKALSRAYEKAMSQVTAYEESRAEWRIPSELADMLDRTNTDIKVMETEIKKLYTGLESKQSELQAQEIMLKQQISQINEDRSNILAKQRKERSDEFVKIQEEKNRLEEKRNTLKKEISQRNVLKKIKMKKEKGAVKELGAKIKSVNRSMRKLRNIVIEEDGGSELKALELSLRAVQEEAQNHAENFSDKLRMLKTRLEAAKEKVENITMNIEQRKLEHTVTVSAEVMQGLVSLNEQLNAFTDNIEKMKAGKISDKKVMNKIEALSALLMGAKEKKEGLFTILKGMKPLEKPLTVLPTVSQDRAAFFSHLQGQMAAHGEAATPALGNASAPTMRK